MSPQYWEKKRGENSKKEASLVLGRRIFFKKFPKVFERVVLNREAKLLKKQFSNSM